MLMVLLAPHQTAFVTLRSCTLEAASASTAAQLIANGYKPCGQGG